MRFMSFEVELEIENVKNNFLDPQRLMRHGMILTNWVNWTVMSHKIIHIFLYQVINDGTVLVLY